MQEKWHQTIQPPSVLKQLRKCLDVGMRISLNAVIVQISHFDMRLFLKHQGSYTSSV